LPCWENRKTAFIDGLIGQRLSAMHLATFLVVPRAAAVEFKNILVATDGSGHANAAVSEAVDIAERCGSQLIAASAFSYG
jgi:hypothetical protein